MASILSKLATQLHNEFRGHLDYLFFKKFGIMISTYYSDVEKRLVSVRKDGNPLTCEQTEYLEAITETYMMILGLVRRA
jgi:mRNA deadenylase 3'-5' endonuclease subunit Ccr4